MLTFSPDPIFIGCPFQGYPELSSISNARILAWTTSETWTKSRLCSPSPTIFNFFFSPRAFRNRPMTGAYCPFVGERSLNTLKYRNMQVLSPYSLLYMRIISSPQYLVAEYGFKQSIGTKLLVGSLSVLP